MNIKASAGINPETVSVMIFVLRLLFLYTCLNSLFCAVDFPCNLQ
jgi:hypothetical protein